MATRKTAAKTEETVQASKSRALTNWNEELAKYAEAASKQEATTAGGQFFGIKSGVLTWQDAPVANNKMAVIILDSMFENVYYEGRYDPDTRQVPLCFAIAKEESELAPHENVRTDGSPQCESCKGCPMNEFGSAETGKGKACRNTRRLAMIMVGTYDRKGDLELNEDPEHYRNEPIGFMKLPVTSVKGYASFVRQAAAALKRPPFGIVTCVSVVPDPKTQFKVLFEAVEEVSDELMQAVMSRREEAEGTIDFPYNLKLEEEEPKPKRSNKAAKPAPKKTARKY